MAKNESYVRILMHNEQMCLSCFWVEIIKTLNKHTSKRSTWTIANGKPHTEKLSKVLHRIYSTTVDNFKL